jgi:hypothetical protein
MNDFDDQSKGGGGGGGGGDEESERERKADAAEAKMRRDRELFFTARLKQSGIDLVDDERRTPSDRLESSMRIFAVAHSAGCPGRMRWGTRRMERRTRRAGANDETSR